MSDPALPRIADIAFRILGRAPEAHVTICDLTPAMLQQGRDRAYDHNILTGCDWVGITPAPLLDDSSAFGSLLGSAISRLKQTS